MFYIKMLKSYSFFLIDWKSAAVICWTLLACLVVPLRTQDSLNNTQVPPMDISALLRSFGVRNMRGNVSSLSLFPWIDWLRQTGATQLRRCPGICGRLSLCPLGIRNQWEVHGLYIRYVLQVLVLSIVLKSKCKIINNIYYKAILERWKTEVWRQGNYKVFSCSQTVLYKNWILRLMMMGSIIAIMSDSDSE